MATNGEDVVDLGDCTPVDSIVYEFRRPDGSGRLTGWKVELCHVSHPKAQAWINEKARQRIQREVAMEVASASGRRWVPEERSPDERRLDDIRWVLSRILNWTPVKIPLISPSPLPYSESTATLVFMHPKMDWALSQIVDVLNAERSFMPRSASLSESMPSASSPSPQETKTE